MKRASPSFGKLVVGLADMHNQFLRKIPGSARIFACRSSLSKPLPKTERTRSACLPARSAQAGARELFIISRCRRRRHERFLGKSLSHGRVSKRDSRACWLAAHLEGSSQAEAGLKAEAIIRLSHRRRADTWSGER